MPTAEVILWSGLKRLRVQGFQFRRQAPFRGYYLDFVCFSRRIVVEADGDSHNTAEQATHDATRDGVLIREGFRVLRFWNGEIRENLDGVMCSIRAALEAAPVSPPGSRLRRELPSP